MRHIRIILFGVCVLGLVLAVGCKSNRPTIPETAGPFAAEIVDASFNRSELRYTIRIRADQAVRVSREDIAYAAQANDSHQLQSSNGKYRIERANANEDLMLNPVVSQDPLVDIAPGDAYVDIGVSLMLGQWYELRRDSGNRAGSKVSKVPAGEYELSCEVPFCYFTVSSSDGKEQLTDHHATIRPKGKVTVTE